MIDLDPIETDTYTTSRPDIVQIFLGLFLLVLAFFILLVSISTFEKVKSSAVMDSLTSTFTTVLPPTADTTQFNAKDGDFIAGEAFQEEITQLFSTAIRVDKIEVVKPGRLMRLTMPASALFDEGAVTVRADQQALMDRVVAALSNRPPGLRQDMEVVLGTALLGDAALPVEQTLETQRAGSLARMLVGRGAPPDSISVGLKPGDMGQVSLWFWVRGVEESATRFEDALQELRDRDAQPAAAPLPTLTPDVDI